MEIVLRNMESRVLTVDGNVLKIDFIDVGQTNVYVYLDLPGGKQIRYPNRSGKWRVAKTSLPSGSHLCRLTMGSVVPGSLGQSYDLTVKINGVGIATAKGVVADAENGDAAQRSFFINVN